MMKLQRGVIRSALIVMTSVVIGATALYGCGGESPTATPVPAPTATTAPAPPTATTAAAAPTTAAPTAATGSTGSSCANQANDPAAINIMQQSARAMQSLKSVHTTMQLEGGAAAGTAEGDIDLPDKMRLTLTTPQGTSEEILIGSKMYVKVPGTDTYMSLPSTPALLSLAATIKNMNAYTQYAQGASLVGGEKVAGADTQHVKYCYDPDKVNAFFFESAGLPTPAPTNSSGTLATGEMWIDRGSNYVRQYKYTVPTESGAQNAMQTVTVQLSKFNEPVSPPIEQPTNVQQLPGLPTLTP